MKRLLHIFVVLALLMVLVAPVVAQDVPPDAPPNIPPVPDFEEVYSAGYAALIAVFAGLVSFLATTPLISILKSIPPFNLKNSAGEPLLTGDQINLIIAILFSAITWGATALGYREQITTLWKLVFAMLPILAGASANYFANRKAFGVIKGKMPIAGYSRTP
jgi:hypothetical protein